jgi:hypothetical protein
LSAYISGCGAEQALAWPMKSSVFLWLLAMIAGLGLMIWLLPPSEIEARLKERGMSGDRR